MVKKIDEQDALLKAMSALLVILLNNNFQQDNQYKTPVNDDNKILFNSFNGILHRLENVIRESRPRMYPSPS